MSAAAAAAPRARPAAPWADAVLAARLLARARHHLGGIVLRGPPGPARDRWLQILSAALPQGCPIRRLPAGTGDDRLLGGLDLAATLSAGRPVIQRGLLAEADDGILIVPMAERLSTSTAARIAGAVDAGAVTLARDGLSEVLPSRIAVVLLDEGITEDEQPPASLCARVAFQFDVSAVTAGDLEATEVAPAERTGIEPEAVSTSGEIVAALTVTAARVGIAPVGVPLMAVRVARTLAAMDGRTAVSAEDATVAARLVIAPRATQAPEQPPEETPPEPEPDQHADSPPPGDDDGRDQELTDIVLAAVMAALPDDLLAQATDRTTRAGVSAGRGAGAARQHPRHGRPVGERAGSWRGGHRLALVATLRAAAPWQRLRRMNQISPRRIEVRATDLRVRKFAERRESAIIFCVDASGSTAFHRLAEAKGAVELLLAEAYAARTFAGLVAFRGAGAEILLPPTRSLSRARALLAQLPGGGGTPLAAGLETALNLADLERRRERTPLIVVLTDARGNIARDGTAGHDRARDDATAAAEAVHASGIASILIDTSPRPRDDGRNLAQAMHARYVPLPIVKADAVRDAIRAATA